VIVIDASAATELLLDTRVGRQVGVRMLEAEGELFAPHVFDLEVAQALRRCARRGLVSSDYARMAVQDLADLAIVRQPHDVLLPRIWSLRENATAYDAAYLALAEALDAPLVTCDARLAKVPGFAERVEVI
jgi:predicted nucleic acid-binding protein